MDDTIIARLLLSLFVSGASREKCSYGAKGDDTVMSNCSVDRRIKKGHQNGSI